ncbi:MAG TPA: archaemetzincin family Zn-dependent metalloprotease [Acidobacteriota bacterium]|nr:archaemetzincin family Zn-dependent metalloprotease [Acidobacteriota bacterium]
MNVIDFIEIGPVPAGLFRELARAVAEEVGVAWRAMEHPLDPEYALIPNRVQYNSTEIVTDLIDMKPKDSLRIMGITEVDLCIPILTFVFGEAQLGCCAAVASLHRLHQEFYGLPPDPRLLFERAVKEILHELGHTFGLRHCPDYSCVMHSSTIVDEIDLKGDTYCSPCRQSVEACKAKRSAASS